MILRALPFVLAFAGAICINPALYVAGQTESPPETPSAPAGAPNNASGMGPIQEFPVEGMYFRDKDGNPVFWPEMSLEKMQQLWDQVHGNNQDQPPEILIRHIQIDVRLEGDHAVLDVTADVEARIAGWRSVNLRFAEAVIDRSSLRGDASRPLIAFDDTAQGHIAWIDVVEPGPATLSFRLLAPLTERAGKTDLLIDAPRAPTKVKLEIAGRHGEAQINGAPRNRIVANDVRNGKTTLVTEGGGGRFSIAWGAPENGEKGSEAILESMATISATIENQRHVRYDAELTVDSLGGEFQSFRVRLPPNTVLLPSNPSSYRVAALAGAANARAPIVEVSLAAPTQEPITVRLRAATPRDPANPRAEPPLLKQISGFEILDAVWQRGQVNLLVEGDWSLSLTPNEVMQSDESSAVTAAAKNRFAGFRFNRQPWSMGVEVRGKPSRVNVDPSFVFEVFQREIRMRAVFHCRSRGPRERVLAIDLNGWSDVHLDPAHFDDVEIEVKAGRLTMPLPSTLEQVMVGIEARLPIDEGAEFLEITPPGVIAPATDQLSQVNAGAAVYAIVPADNIQLTPQADQIQSMTAETSGSQQAQLAAALGLGGLRRGPLFYRQRIDAAPARFASDFRVRPQTISVAVLSNVELSRRLARIEQRFQYDVAYGAVKKLMLIAPPSLVDDSNPTSLNAEVLVDGIAAEAVVLPQDDAALDESGAPVEVILPETRNGRIELAVKFEQVLDAFEGGSAQPVVLDLTTPRAQPDLKLTANEMRISPNADVDAEIADDGWSLLPSPATDGEEARRLRARADMDGAKAALLVTAGVRPRRVGAVVRRCWLQTWLTESQRRDRAVFAVSGGADQIRIQLPEGALADASMTVAVNGQRANYELVGGESSMLQINTRESLAADEQVVELIYRFDAQRSSSHNISLDAPHVLNADGSDQVFWQLVTPRHEHLLTAPAGLTPQLVWGFRGLFWDRQASLSQRDLEKWSGASMATGLVLPESTNKYLFSAIGPVEHVEFWTVSRWVVVLMASGAVLLFALVMMRQPRMRRGEVLFAAGILLIAAAVLHPESSLLLAQASATGIAAATVGGLMRWLSARRQSAGIVHGRTHASTDSNVADVLPMTSEAGSQATTATAPASLPLSEAESNA